MEAIDKTCEEIINQLSQFTGAEHYHKMTFNPYLLFTDGMKFLFDEYKAYWLGDLINSYFPNIMRDFNENGDTFYIINIKVEHGLLNACFTVSREVEGKPKTIVEQKVGYIALPAGDYQFFMTVEPRKDGVLSGVVMLPSEY